MGGDFFWGRFFFSSLKSGKVSIYDGEGRGGGGGGRGGYKVLAYSTGCR